MQKQIIAGIGVIGFVILLIIGLIVVFSGIDSVDANHLGVMVNLGQIKGTMQPGVQWTGLFTEVYQYDMRTRQDVIELTGANGAVDKTGQAVYATVNINYRLISAKDTVVKLYTNVGLNNEVADKLNINAIVREGFKQATAQYDSLEILEKRQEVKEKAIAFIKNNFPSDYFELQNVVITNIDFSEEFKKAIENKKVAEQNAQMEKNQLEVVKFQQQQQLEVFKVDAEKMKLQKTEITDLLVKQQMISKWDGRMPQYLIVTDASQGMFLQLAKGNIDAPITGTP